MKRYIVLRILQEYDYLTQNKATIRATATAFGVSKSTVHKDISLRLYYIDKEKFAQAEKLLKQNFDVKHLRGGASTKKKYRAQ